jgi:hypothetical protein
MNPPFAGPAPLSALLGVWEGQGVGHYPTIEPFTYRERVTFSHIGKPFLTYHQRTWHPETGAGMHTEAGYLRGSEHGAVEWLVVQPTGLAELHEGRMHNGVVELAPTVPGRTSTAKAVQSVRRRLVVGDATLSYDVWMAYGDVAETHHLHADLARARPASAETEHTLAGLEAVLGNVWRGEDGDDLGMD